MSFRNLLANTNDNAIFFSYAKLMSLHLWQIWQKLATFRQIFIFFEIFDKKLSKFVIDILAVWPQPLFSPSSLMTPFYGENSVTKIFLVLSCSPSTPVTSKVECPRPLYYAMQSMEFHISILLSGFPDSIFTNFIWNSSKLSGLG